MVDENQYRSIVKGRLLKDDFVVDDGIGGYTDNGMDDWTGGDMDQEESDDEEIIRRKKKGVFVNHIIVLIHCADFRLQGKVKQRMIPSRASRRHSLKLLLLPLPSARTDQLYRLNKNKS